MIVLFRRVDAFEIDVNLVIVGLIEQLPGSLHVDGLVLGIDLILNFDDQEEPLCLLITRRAILHAALLIILVIVL